MTISVDCATKVITIPRADLTALGGSRYQLDVNWLRLQLKAWEQSADGMAMPGTHVNYSPLTLSGVTYARQFAIINGYTVTFEAFGSPYRVECVGGNHNLGDVQNVNNVSLLLGNSAGLVQVNTGGSGLSTDEHNALIGLSGSTPSAATIAEAVWLRAIEAGIPADAVVRILLAALAGKSTGVGSSTEKYLARDGTTPRVIADFDSQGNRTDRKSTRLNSSHHS